MTANRARAIAALEGHGQPPMSKSLRASIIDRLEAAGLLKQDTSRLIGLTLVGPDGRELEIRAIRVTDLDIQDRGQTLKIFYDKDPVDLAEVASREHPGSTSRPHQLTTYPSREERGHGLAAHR